jgi:hypothetical protein
MIGKRDYIWTARINETTQCMAPRTSWLSRGDWPRKEDELRTTLEKIVDIRRQEGQKLVGRERGKKNRV